MKRIFAKACIKLLEVLRFLFAAVQEEFCVVCGEGARVIPICPECKKKYFAVQKLSGEFCEVCGRRLFSEKRFCMVCRGEPLLKSTEKVFPLYPYRLWNTELLCRWKLQDERCLSVFFARKMHERLKMLKEQYGNFHLVPVPPREGKLKERGWDQVKELSFYLEKLFDYEVIWPLKRISQVQQKKLDRKDRLETIGKAYTLVEGVKNLPERVCLIDDVITTGATIEACAEELKKGGVKSILAVSLFTVDS